MTFGRGFWFREMAKYTGTHYKRKLSVEEGAETANLKMKIPKYQNAILDRWGFEESKQIICTDSAL